jgi:hypothetical protein
MGAMAGIHHIDNLNDGIEFKKIELKDNSAKLKLLDKKYEDLNRQLEKEGADKVKLEEERLKLEKEKEELNKALQAKIKKKEADIAFQAQKALVAPVQVPKAYASSSCAEWMAQAGIASTTATNKLILKESNCRPHAINPSSGACGIPQAYPCSKLQCPLNESGAVCQLQWMDRYVKNRYGSWDNALATWYSRCGSPQGCWY